MGSLKAQARFLAGHRCERCKHPYVPKGDAVMLDQLYGMPEGQHVEPSWRDGGWSPCDAYCAHAGPIRFRPPAVVEGAWRILTVHHLDGDKANVRWWNLTALCQRCHLEIQSRVVMERVYPHEHSEWFKPHAAGYYAWVYLGEELTREQTVGRLAELLALEAA